MNEKFVRITGQANDPGCYQTEDVVALPGGKWAKSFLGDTGFAWEFSLQEDVPLGSVVNVRFFLGPADWRFQAPKP